MKITTKKELVNILNEFFKFINHNTVLHKFAPEKFNEISKMHAEIFYKNQQDKLDKGGFLNKEDDNGENS